MALLFDWVGGWAVFSREVSPLLTDAFRREAPVRTGKLQASIGTQEGAESLSVVSDDVTDSGYRVALGVISGTKAHDIVPRQASVLVFYASDGKLVFTRHVSHPGTARNTFHSRAWHDVEPEVVALFARRVGGTLRVRTSVRTINVL